MIIYIIYATIIKFIQIYNWMLNQSNTNQPISHSQRKEQSKKEKGFSPCLPGHAQEMDDRRGKKLQQIHGTWERTGAVRHARGSRVARGDLRATFASLVGFPAVRIPAVLADLNDPSCRNVLVFGSCCAKLIDQQQAYWWAADLVSRSLKKYMDPHTSKRRALLAHGEVPARLGAKSPVLCETDSPVDPRGNPEVWRSWSCVVWLRLHGMVTCCSPDL